MTSDGDHEPIPESAGEPAGLPAGWSARPPALEDLDCLVELRSADRLPWTGSGAVDRKAIELEITGPASWTRRQLVAMDPDGVVRAWVTVHDRAAGRTMVALYADRTAPEPARLATSLYAWAEQQAQEICLLREIDATRLDASPFQKDRVQQEWLASAGYQRRRTWWQMSRPVQPDEARTVPRPRAGVTIRRVASHDNGLPVARDLQLVHEMLEASFQDHFNSYRESFPEFVQRLREDPGHRWDHWWLAFVEGDEGESLAAGTLVSSVLPPDATGHEGSYVDYIGVHRHARGRGVAKSLLHTVIADAAERGRNRVALEVDADSPTGADGLYRSMGWETDYVIESWFIELSLDDRPGGATRGRDQADRP